MSQTILLIGATSGIAEALARRYAQQAARLFLVARNREKLQLIATDLSLRGAQQVDTLIMDLNETDQLPQLVESAWQALGSIDVALIAQGTLPDQLRAEQDLAYAIAEFRTNAESLIACLAVLAERFQRQHHGTLAVIGSVAGDRGRSSNYLYGAAKAAVDVYASGLRARLFKQGVHLLTIKPGFVATPMTAHLRLPALLTATPDRVAKAIQQAIIRRKDCLYTPWFWQWIMLIIRGLPSPLFKRMTF